MVNANDKQLVQKALILSDGKPGHVNQSIAFCKLLEIDYEIRTLRPKSRLFKALSYLADRLFLYTKALFAVDGGMPPAHVVVSAGSDTYYANKVIAKTLGARAVAIMLPKGFRYDFDLIVAQQHDQPPRQENILVLPVNLSCSEPQGFINRIEGKTCVSIIVGGPSRHFQMDTGQIKRQLEQIYELFPGADFLATTSRRTPPDVESLIEQGPFRYKVIASRENINPIPDFLAISDYVFVTEDSTSMISEAVTFGKACVEVLPMSAFHGANKVSNMLRNLEKNEFIHYFHGVLGRTRRKLSLVDEIRTAYDNLFA